MAYALKYYSALSNITYAGKLVSSDYSIEIEENEYIGTSTEIEALSTSAVSVQLDNTGDMDYEPIKKSSLTISIIDTDQFDYTQFFTPDTLKYRVKLKRGATILWQGFITPDSYSQQLSNKAEIVITARDNIGYLDQIDFDQFNQFMSFKTLINTALEKTGVTTTVTYDVNIKSDDDDDYLYDHKINTNIFSDKTWYEAIEEALKSTGCQLRFSSGFEVIEITQFHDDTNIITDPTFLGGTKQLEFNPAWRTAQFNQEYGNMENFFTGFPRLLSDWITQGTGEGLWHYKYFFQYPPDSEVLHEKEGTFNYNTLLPQNIISNSLILTNEVSSYCRYSWVLSPNNPPVFGAVTSDTYTKKLPYDKLNIINDTASGDNFRALIYQLNDIVPTTSQLELIINVNKYISMYMVNCYNVFESPDFFIDEESYATGTDKIEFIFDIICKIDNVQKRLVNGEWVDFSATPDRDNADIVLTADGASGSNEDLNIYVNGIKDLTTEFQIIIYEPKQYYKYIGEYRNADSLETVIDNADNCTWTTINSIKASYPILNETTGQETKIEIDLLNNVKEEFDFEIGQVPDKQASYNAFAGGVYDDAKLPIGNWYREKTGNKYNLLELVSRGILNNHNIPQQVISGTIITDDIIDMKLIVIDDTTYMINSYVWDVVNSTAEVELLQVVEYTDRNYNIEIGAVSGGSAAEFLGSGQDDKLIYSLVGGTKRVSELASVSDPDNYELLLDNAGQTASRKITWSNIADKLRNILSDVFMRKDNNLNDLEDNETSRINLNDGLATELKFIDNQNTQEIGGNKSFINILSLLSGWFVGTFQSGFAGSGARVVEQDGKTTLEIDNIKVRNKFSVNKFETKSVSSVGGELIVTNSIVVDNIEDSLIYFWILNNGTWSDPDLWDDTDIWKDN